MFLGYLIIWFSTVWLCLLGSWIIPCDTWGCKVGAIKDNFLELSHPPYDFTLWPVVHRSQMWSVCVLDSILMYLWNMITDVAII